MLSKGELNILKAFKKNYFKSYTFSEIKTILKESSNNKLQLALKSFEESELIKIERNKGFNLIYLNLNSNLLTNYFSLLDFEFFREKEKKILFEIKNVFSKRNIFCSLVVFGSFSKGENKKGSDLDLAIVTENKISSTIISEIESIKRKSLVEIDEHYFSIKEFVDMLKLDKENLGKEISRNFNVFYGGEFFYNLIFENGKFN